MDVITDVRRIVAEGRGQIVDYRWTRDKAGQITIKYKDNTEKVMNLDIEAMNQLKAFLE